MTVAFPAALRSEFGCVTATTSRSTQMEEQSPSSLMERVETL